MSTTEDRLARMEERIRETQSMQPTDAATVSQLSLSAFLRDAGIEEHDTAIHQVDLVAVEGEPRRARNGPTKERLVELELRYRAEETQQRLLLWQKIIESLRVAVVILVAWFPLSAFAELAQQLKVSNYQAAIAAVSGVAIAATAGWAVTATQSRLRKRRIVTMDQRLSELERHLLRARREHEDDWRREMIDELEGVRKIGTVVNLFPSRHAS